MRKLILAAALALLPLAAHAESGTFLLEAVSNHLNNGVREAIVRDAPFNSLAACMAASGALRATIHNGSNENGPTSILCVFVPEVN